MMETLKGKNIIERMNQLMNYGKSTPTVKEGRNWANVEYTIKAPNGKTYGILRDQTKFYIKESSIDNPTIKDFEFIDGIINGAKKSYTNYSHALTYLNLMIAEMNQKNPKAKAINLLECETKKPMEEGSIEDSEVPAEIQEKKEKEVDEKTVLKVPQKQPAAPAPAPEAPAQPKGDSGLDMGGDEDTPDLDLGDDLGGDDESEDGLGDEEPIEGGEEVKTIQKLTGKLGQKMRDLDKPDPDLTKYVINSVMSALDLQDLEAKDQKQIVKKMKKKMAGEGEMEDESDDAGLDLGDDGGEDLGLGNDEGNAEASTDLDFGNEKEKTSKLNEISGGLATRATRAAYAKADTAVSNDDPILHRKLRNQIYKFKSYINPQIQSEIQRLGGSISSKGTDNMIKISFNNLGVEVYSDNYKIVDGTTKDTDPKIIQVLPRLIKKIQADLNTKNSSQESEIQESDAPYGEKKEPQNIKTASAPFNEKPKNIKTESKIQKTIKKYFELTPEEKKQKDNQFLSESINKAMLLKEGKSKCKTIEQEIALGKVLDYDKNFVIKTMKESVIVDTNRKINLGGNEYKKLIMVETSGKVSGILKDTVKKTARQYRMKDKKDYLNFIKLGK